MLENLTSMTNIWNYAIIGPFKSLESHDSPSWVLQRVAFEANHYHFVTFVGTVAFAAAFVAHVDPFAHFLLTCN